MTLANTAQHKWSTVPLTFPITASFLLPSLRSGLALLGIEVTTVGAHVLLAKTIDMGGARTTDDICEHRSGQMVNGAVDVADLVSPSAAKPPFWPCAARD